jgi:hypothetical protein
MGAVTVQIVDVLSTQANELTITILAAIVEHGRCPQWRRSFASQYKDSRYYEVLRHPGLPTVDALKAGKKR